MSRPLPAFRLTEAVRPRQAPAPIDPTIVPVARLTKREQYFRCAPYACTLSAGVCVDRQAQRVQIHSTGGTKIRYGACAECATGAKIARKVPALVRVLPQNAERKHLSRLEMQRLRAAGGA